jgi:hypothetical protein
MSAITTAPEVSDVLAEAMWEIVHEWLDAAVSDGRPGPQLDGAVGITDGKTWLHQAALVRRLALALGFPRYWAQWACWRRLGGGTRVRLPLVPTCRALRPSGVQGGQMRSAHCRVS